MREYNYPQYKFNNTPKIRSNLYKNGEITAVRKSWEDAPLSLRFSRAEIYKNCINDPTGEKRKYIDKADELDNLYNQFLNNRFEIVVDMGELGIQRSQSVVLESKNRDKTKPTVIVIPGLSNDVDGLGSFPIELAKSGRRVIVLSYQESWRGKTTKENSKAVKKSEKFEPHVNFFKGCVRQLINNKLINDEEKMDFFGVSTGGIIVAEIMADDEFNKNIDQTTLVVPAGISKVFSLKGGAVGELIFNLKGNINLLAKLSVHPQIKIYKSLEDARAAKKTYRALASKIREQYPWWKNELISGSGKKTKVICFENDRVVKSHKGIENLINNPTLEVMELGGGGHASIGIEPERIIEAIYDLDLRATAVDSSPGNKN